MGLTVIGVFRYHGIIFITKTTSHVVGFPLPVTEFFGLLSGGHGFDFDLTDLLSIVTSYLLSMKFFGQSLLRLWVESGVLPPRFRKLGGRRRPCSGRHSRGCHVHPAW